MSIISYLSNFGLLWQDTCISRCQEIESRQYTKSQFVDGADIQESVHENETSYFHSCLLFK